jgi:hypothetical protein
MDRITQQRVIDVFKGQQQFKRLVDSHVLNVTTKLKLKVKQSHLFDAHQQLHQNEKDLLIAGEIGQQLLAENVELRSKLSGVEELEQKITSQEVLDRRCQQLAKQRQQLRDENIGLGRRMQELEHAAEESDYNQRSLQMDSDRHAHSLQLQIVEQREHAEEAKEALGQLQSDVAQKAVSWAKMERVGGSVAPGLSSANETANRRINELETTLASMEEKQRLADIMCKRNVVLTQRMRGAEVRADRAEAESRRMEAEVQQATDMKMDEVLRRLRTEQELRQAAEDETGRAKQALEEVAIPLWSLIGVLLPTMLSSR